MLSNPKALNTCTDNKRKKSDSFKVIFGKKIILNCNRSILGILVWCEKKAYSATGMENNVRLLDKSRI